MWYLIGRKKRYGIAVVIVVMIAVTYFTALFCGPYLVMSTEGNNNYLIRISGLENATTDGVASLMVPLPVYLSGEPVFSETMMERVRAEPGVYHLNPGWNMSVETTSYGDLLVFRSDAVGLSDIDMILAEFDRESGPRMLMPAVSLPGNATTEEFCRNDRGKYRSVVCADNITLPAEGTIDFALHSIGGGKKRFLFSEPVWESSVRVSVSSGDIGYVDTNVTYSVSDSWN